MPLGLEAPSEVLLAQSLVASSVHPAESPGQVWGPLRVVELEVSWEDYAGLGGGLESGLGMRSCTRALVCSLANPLSTRDHGDPQKFPADRITDRQGQRAVARISCWEFGELRI